MKPQLYDADCLKSITVEDRKTMLEIFDEWSEHIPERFRQTVRRSLEACVNADQHGVLGKEVA